MKIEKAMVINGYNIPIHCSNEMMYKMFIYIIPSGTTNIAKKVFMCKPVYMLKIPNSLIEIRKSAFAFSNIYHMIIDKDCLLLYVHSDAFIGNSLGHITLPKHVIHIGTDAFYDCKLKYLDLSETKIITLQSIADSNPQLQKIKLPYTIDEIVFFPIYDKLPKITGKFKIIEKHIYKKHIWYKPDNLVHKLKLKDSYYMDNLYDVINNLCIIRKDNDIYEIETDESKCMDTPFVYMGKEYKRMKAMKLKRKLSMTDIVKMINGD